MKTSKPLWHFLLSLLLFGVVTFWIVYSSINEKLILITSGEFAIIFFLGFFCTILFGVWIKHDSVGDPMEIDTLMDGAIFEIVTCEILYTGKDQEIVYCIRIEYDDDENYDTTKSSFLRLENSDLGSPTLFVNEKNWKNLRFMYSDGKISKM